jgi:hypothetical protein
VDLLTVLAHELAHLLGYDHTEESALGDLMEDVLPIGVRRILAQRS